MPFIFLKGVYIMENKVENKLNELLTKVKEGINTEDINKMIELHCLFIGIVLVSKSMIPKNKDFQNKIEAVMATMQQNNPLRMLQ